MPNLELLRQLQRDEPVAAVDALDLDVRDRRSKDALVGALADSKTPLVDMLGALTRDRLKALCRALRLGDAGREKAAIIDPADLAATKGALVSLLLSGELRAVKVDEVAT